MKNSLRWGVVAGVSVIALGATAVVAVTAWNDYQSRISAPSSVDTDAQRDWTQGDRIVFRNTASGAGYGLVASVPLDDPAGTRALSDVACDRVDATATLFSCLQIVRGITPTYVASVYDDSSTEVAQWPLPGIPSRTRISSDGAMIATTAFVTGHSYAFVGFSTSTQIYTPDGTDLGNLEDWTLLIDGTPSAPLDRNFWGITFVRDTTSFYATVGMTTIGTTYLVKGDLATRTLTTLAQNVECPSLAPDGTRIAFKRVTAGAGPTAHWTPAIFDIATGDVRLLPESRSIDDQIEWLDDDTILYGVPRTDTPGDTDVWSVPADGLASPQVFIEHAWSPSVVHADGRP